MKEEDGAIGKAVPDDEKVRDVPPRSEPEKSSDLDGFSAKQILDAIAVLKAQKAAVEDVPDEDIECPHCESDEVEYNAQMIHWECLKCLRFFEAQTPRKYR